MKISGICFLIFSAKVLTGQGYFQPASDQLIHLDQIEIQSGTLFSNHLQIRPLNKIRSIDECLRLVTGEMPVTTQFNTIPTELLGQQSNPNSTVGVAINQCGNSSSDTTSIIQLIKDNIEVLYSDLADTSLAYLKSANPFLKYFYKDGTHFLSAYKKNFQISLDPLLHFDVGKEDSDLLFFNRRGLRLQGSIDQRVFFHSDIIETQLASPAYVHEYIDLYQSFPGAGLYKTYNSRFPKSDRAYDFLIAEAAIEFKASKHIHVSLGHGRHFIGSGIRTLLLSDFAAPQFYLRINTNIWKLHYQNLFAELTPESLGGQGNRLLDKKYMAAHYLSINLTKNWNAGIFESVVFSRKNNFEYQYLNPVILYRSVEHSLGSPDNVFIGFHSNIILWKKFSVYGQMLFDEFLFKEFFKSDGWWGNKYGFQTGCKYINAFSVKNLFLQLEYNQVRPYTYTFRDSLANYTHYHQALAHPLGANFKEFIFHINYQPDDRWSFSSRWFYFSKGLDSTGVNNGGNILLNYDTRSSDFGHTTSQGISNKVLNGSLQVSYRLFYRAWLDVNLYIRNSKTARENNDTFLFSAGFRMNLDRMKFDF